jgi:HK97 gp10 family phage protein
MSIKVRIHGLAELKANLERLPVELGRQALRRALRAAAAPIRARARELAPRDTGKLADAIVVRDDRKTPLAASVVVTVASEGFYAHMLEFGTAPHVVGGRAPGARHPGTAPRPFLRPAFDETQEAALAEFVKRLERDLETIARSGRITRRGPNAGGGFGASGVGRR